MTSTRAPLGLYLTIAFGGAWLAALPLWTSELGLAHPALPITLAGMQLSPTLAVLAVWLLARLREDPAAAPRTWARDTGLTLGGRSGRALRFTAATWIAVPVVVAVVIALSALAGVFPTDLAGLSGYRRAFPQGDHSTAALGLVISIVIGTLSAALGAFGEEWGWRGWLLPRLMPLGRGAALALSGVIWGLWHAPLTLLGFNYPGLGAWGAPLFTLTCVTIGAVLGWLRLRTGSVWPAVLGHAAFNSSVPALYLITSDARSPLNPLLGGVFGLTGWLVIGALATLLLRLRPVTEPAGSGPVRTR
ncbi:CPBP family intramembrane glutamic endopeptidase [Nonomuraea sp. NPDC046570]|uniref:CPBP family intramembrane glutamic endopeptidase n=1 Tax=Nonomuraea sp. NPDC046570 TaxID=3155255 RepID=UPI0033CB7D0B